MLPWIVFLFSGAADAGFSFYGLIAVDSAVRSAAMYTSSSTAVDTDASTACTKYVLPELTYLPNVGSGVTSCNALPVVVTVTAVTGPDSAVASKVSVQYQTPRMAPIPGIFSGQTTFTRSLTMRVKQ